MNSTACLTETRVRIGSQHVRVGFEDARLGTTISNLVMVEQAVRMVRDHGAEPASAAELRQALGTLA